MDQMVLETQKWLNNTYSGQSGFTPFTQNELDGVTGVGTFRRLIQALQIELHISVDGNFGNGTLSALPATISTSNDEKNMSYIIQGSLWCKGYSAGSLDGKFGETTKNAIIQFQNDAGITADGIIKPYILQGIMNTDGYKYTGESGTNEYYKHLVQIGMNTYYGTQIGLTAPNGLWERKSHKNYIKCCQIEWGATPVDGVWGNGTMNKAPTLSGNTSGYTNSKRLLQWGLTINGFYPGNLTGNFDSTMYTAVYDFQDFLCLGADGVAGKTTWASLLTSRGNTSRSATAFDTSTRLTVTTARALKNAGYTDVGRYLTNVEGSSLDKKMTAEELQIIQEVGLKVFPIYQTYGGEVSYFTRYQGRKDADAAKKAAKNFGFPPTSTIYFAIDYDALMADIASNIIPYFQGIKEMIGWSFRIGVYGPRAVCNRLLENGLARYSFVADMSTGFTGNIGQTMPKNWAYEQFYETTVGGIGIDKCIASARRTAISPQDFISYIEPDEPSNEQKFDVYKEVFNMAWEYLKGLESPYSEVYANILDANRLALAYFRSEKYDADHFDFSDGQTINSIKGLAWRTIAGPRDEPLLEKIAEETPNLQPTDISITDPKTGIELEITHYAATLGACITSTLGLNINFFERTIDAYAGWAGDVLQLGGTLQYTLDKLGNNYFSLNDMTKMIGAAPSELTNYHFCDKEGNSIADPGFSQVDLLEDVDAYNISKIYDLSTMKIHNALNDYYCISKKYNTRFKIFKRELLNEFDADTIYDVALEFSQQSKTSLLAIGFGYAFGTFDQTYKEVVARAFEKKIENMIEQEM